VIVLIAIIVAVLFATREYQEQQVYHEIAPPLRKLSHIDDSVVMNVRNISNGIVEVYISNDSNAYILFGYPNFSIEHFDSSDWRVLPLRRDVVFPLPGLVINPDSSFTYNMNFAWFYHTPRHGELYRIRLGTSVAYREQNPNHPDFIHDITAEFIYEGE
jgi:hypothetical protein